MIKLNVAQWYSSCLSCKALNPIPSTEKKKEGKVTVDYVMMEIHGCFKLVGHFISKSQQTRIWLHIEEGETDNIPFFSWLLIVLRSA